VVDRSVGASTGSSGGLSGSPHEGTLILAADHRARGVVTIEPYAEYLSAVRAALPACDGILASAQPLADVVAAGAVGPHQRTYLSLNRTGLHGSAFELDDRLVATVAQAAAAGYTGVKLMTRVDLAERDTAAALELLGRVLEEASDAGIEALVEPLSWSAGQVDASVDGIVMGAVIAHDLGAPLLKVPVPATDAGTARIDAIRRVTASVGVPVLFLGGPRKSGRGAVLSAVADAMAGGAAGVALGRALYEDPNPATMAGLVADLVRGRRAADEVLALAARPGPA
jgi:DhnA family fructose-bisphosphate aldolase class Ia